MVWKTVDIMTAGPAAGTLTTSTDGWTCTTGTVTKNPPGVKVLSEMMVGAVEVRVTIWTVEVNVVQVVVYW